jgi:signal transduction histidine kinase
VQKKQVEVLDRAVQPTAMTGPAEAIVDVDSIEVRLEFDRLMVRLIGKISSNDHKELDSVIDSTLSELGYALQVERAHLFIFDFAKETMSCTHEWCATGIVSEIDLLQNISFLKFSWLMNKVKNGQTIAIDDLNDLPSEARIEQEVFLDHGLRSVCVIPLQSRRKTIGFISFGHIRQKRLWQEYTQVLLAILAEAIANAIEGSSTRYLIEMNEARERLFIDAIPALIVRIDKHGCVLDYAVGCHGTLSQYVALHVSTNVNSLDDLFERSIADRIFKELAFTTEGKPSKEYEFDIDVAGKLTTLEMKYSSSNQNEDILVFQDISEKKNLERLKNDFINNATHEMRTPLTTILLMIDLMEKSTDAVKKAEYWDILKGEISRERMLIEDLLTVSRIEKGKYSGIQKQFDICAAVRDAILAIQPQARGVGIQIKELVPLKSIPVVGDPASCQMVFSNLLSNAIKFSPEKGNIEVCVLENKEKVTISFNDHGIGIPSEDLPHIFDRFYRGKNAVRDEIQGSGMGLYIVEHLIHDMGGNVSVESVIGKGTKFTTELPCFIQL